LAESRLFDGNRHDGVFDLLCDAVFQHWLLATDLLQRQLAAFVVKLLEAVEAVAAIAHHLAGLAHIAKRIRAFIYSCRMGSYTFPDKVFFPSPSRLLSSPSPHPHP